MAKYVKCPYCDKQFDRDKVEFVAIGRRYAHKSCHEEAEANKSQEEKDKDKLENYIKKLFNTTTVSVRIQKQITQFRNEYNFTYSGILKALIYFYEIKKNDLKKANGGIGIVPYVYNQAYEYYYALWVAQQKNEAKIISNYIPQVEEVKIPIPVRKEKKKNRFAFLDKEE